MGFLRFSGNQPKVSKAKFAAILGFQPSKGARSPTLWNRCFRKFSIDAEMIPIDVTEENLPALVEALDQDSRFLGGAVAMPYKSAITAHLEGVEAPAGDIGAINCLYRPEKSKRLWGANTDGEAALASIMSGRDVPLREALLIGMGGVGKAVAFYLAHALGKEGKLLVSVRAQRGLEAELLALSRYTQVEVLPFPPPVTAFASLDLLVNTTSIGQANPVSAGKDKGYLAFFSPLGPIPVQLPTSSVLGKECAPFVAENLAEAVSRISSLPPSCLVFDAIYQPLVSPLILLAGAAGRPVKNGLEMNLLQAAIAFRKVFPNFSEKDVLGAMQDENA